MIHSIVNRASRFLAGFVSILFSVVLIMTDASAQNKELKYLALGDSYTIGESVPSEERWPVLLAEGLKSKGILVSSPQIIATTGWRTDELLNAIHEEKPQHDFDLVSLLIGVNNQYQGRSIEEYEKQFEELLKTAIAIAGGDKYRVFVVSIPDYGFTPFGKDKREKISKEIDDFNLINQTIADKYHVRYFYITDISRKGLSETELVASDNLHPSGEMYKQWVNRLLKSNFFEKLK